MKGKNDKRQIQIPAGLLMMSSIQNKKQVAFLQINDDTYCLVPKETIKEEVPIGELNKGKITIPEAIYDGHSVYDFNVRYGTIQMTAMPKVINLW